jgi:mRNA interferase HigB
MHIISRKKLVETAAAHADLEGPLDTWYRIAKRADWKSIDDVRKTLLTADYDGKQYTIFNIKGNSYRLSVKIEYRFQMIYIKHVLTHTEYDKGNWR